MQHDVYICCTHHIKKMKSTKQLIPLTLFIIQTDAQIIQTTITPSNNLTQTN